MRKKGFTLIELLVVVSIIALLVSILVPALGRAREAARAVVCLSTVKNYALSNVVYAGDNDGWFVPYSQAPVRHPDNTWDERWTENTVFRDILTVTQKIDDDGWEDAYIFPDGLLCPSQKAAREDDYFERLQEIYTYGWQVNYGYNVEYWAATDATGYPADHRYRGFKASEARSPSEKLMFIDAISYKVRRWGADYREDSFWAKYGDNAAQQELTNGWAFLFWSSYRHNGNAQISFFDGHGEKMAPEKVYNVDNPSSFYVPTDRDYDPLWDIKWPHAEL